MNLEAGRPWGSSGTWKFFPRVLKPSRASLSPQALYLSAQYPHLILFKELCFPTIPGKGAARVARVATRRGMKYLRRVELWVALLLGPFLVFPPLSTIVLQGHP